MFNHRREISKLSIKQSNIDWFDSLEGDHVYLTIYKKVNLFSLTRKKNQGGSESRDLRLPMDSDGSNWISEFNGIHRDPLFPPWKK
jgi:hypothetical protein